MEVSYEKETITITVEGPSGAVARDWTNSQQFQEYEKRMGLRFEATTYTNEQWDSRLTLMMAGGEMPDALFTSGKMKRSQVKKYIAELRLNGQLPKSLSLDEIPESLKSPVQTWVDACVNGGSDKDYGVDAAIDMVKFMLAAYQSDKEKGKRVTI
jgi:ABC-type glycerol-3-phosphate transport system substrate-binding protein